MNYSQKLPSLDGKSGDERVSAILIPDQAYDVEEDEFVELPEATNEMLTRYYDYLLDKLPVGLRLTGREDLGYFGWEERFIWGGGNDKEYKELKEKFASCDDKFKFIRLHSISEEFGIMAEVQRITDKNLFTIPLADLVTLEEKIKEHQLIEDYSSWFVNFGPEAW